MMYILMAINSKQMGDFFWKTQITYIVAIKIDNKKTIYRKYYKVEVLPVFQKVKIAYSFENPRIIHLNMIILLKSI